MSIETTGSSRADLRKHESDDDVQRLEAERLRPYRTPFHSPQTRLWTELLDLIAAECRRAGYLPATKTAEEAPE